MASRRLPTRLLGALVAVIAATAGLLVVGAAPAQAHSAGTAGSAENYVYVVDPFDPGVEGVELVHLGVLGELRLTNRSDAELVVLGYSGEPYLRIGSDGAWRNTRSPATYLNVDTSGTAPLPDSADPEAVPDWERISETPVASWHDHRSHWMAPAPSGLTRTTELATWRIPLVVDGRPVEVPGRTLWVPGPSPAPWLAVAVTLAAGLALAGLTRWWWEAAAVGTLALLVVTALAVAGTWWGSTGGVVDRLPSAGAMVLVSLLPVAGLALIHTDRRAGTLLLSGGAGLVALLVGGSRLSWLWTSQLPTGLPAGVARAVSAVALGAGLGVALVPLAQWIRRSTSSWASMSPAGTARE